MERCLLYSQKPLEKITVQEIARKAGFNRSTFYQYFLDVNDLLCDVENEFLKYILINEGRLEPAARPLSKTLWCCMKQSPSTSMLCLADMAAISF